MILTIMSEHEESNKVNEELKESLDNDEKNQSFLQKTIIPSDINDIQARATKVWKCDGIGFYFIGRWYKVICNYKFFQGEGM